MSVLTNSRLGRRGFLQAATTAAGAFAVAGVRSAHADEQPLLPRSSDAVLKLSSQEGIIPGDSLREKVLRMEEWGFVGIEPGGGGLPNRINEFQEALKGTQVKVSAICAGFRGAPISDNLEQRELAVRTTKEILSAAGELGSTGMIIVPAFNGQTKLDHVEGRKVLLDVLRDLGDHAQKAGTRVLLEPLNRGEAWFLRMLADAAAICRDVNHPGVCMMGDFFHMNIEETSDMGAFLSAGKYLHHVHLASGRRVMPGQDDRSFVNGFKALKALGYSDYCSLECGCDGDRMIEIPKSVAFLQKQWAEA
ncbi:MAG: sugar phosphate isomerase/epimerase family protein [Verrucomicrobiota bacterium]|jgi:sugar phosphate isomerase/epimerase|nr:sugar phosphate isomerase/epimerase family protein [Verrucomicrobiota bacterium]